MENNNNKIHYYFATQVCSSQKYQKEHIVKSVIIVDSDFEKKLDELMSCDHLTLEPDLV